MAAGRYGLSGSAAGTGEANAGGPRGAAGSLRVCLLGATGTIGRATRQALVRRGHDLVCFVLPVPGGRAVFGESGVRMVDLSDPVAIARDGFRGEPFDAVVSCMASRTGAPADAWAVDHRAHVDVLAAARDAGVRRFVLCSALCVQNPKLAFQHAKLAFEARLIGSGLTYSIVRPTAFFKSLSGQVERVRRGHPFVVFGDGTRTSCKPIGDGDLADYLADCLADPALWNRILPIGGPGRAITPREQGEALFALLGRRARFRSVPVGLLDAIVSGLALAGRVVPSLADKAELARIGRYYATESMLVRDGVTGRPDAQATPSTGTETLFDFYRALVSRERSADLGDHAVFASRAGHGTGNRIRAGFRTGSGSGAAGPIAAAGDAGDGRQA